MKKAKLKTWHWVVLIIVALYVIGLIRSEVPEERTKKEAAAPPTSDPKTTLTPLARAWTDRLKIDFDSRNTIAVQETLEDIKNRYDLEKITGDDFLVLRDAAETAPKGNWDEAYLKLGFEPPAADTSKAPSESLPVGASVSAHGIYIPLPDGATIVSHRPGNPPIDDDIWHIAFSDIEAIQSFYSVQLSRQGWNPYPILGEGCWTKPRAQSSENEIVCITPRNNRQFEIRIAP